MLEVVARDAWKAAKWAGPPAYNGLGRYGLVTTAGALEATAGTVGLGSLALTKGIVEYGVAKPLWWGIKGVYWCVVKTCNRCTGGNAWTPDMTHFNWGNAGNARPGYMDWF